MLFLVVYMAFSLAQNLFFRGGETVLEQMYVRTLFARISQDLQFLSRFNYITAGEDGMMFEIFSVKTISTDPSTNDKIVQGQEVIYSTTKKKDRTETEYIVLLKRVNEYEWKEYFGKSQIPDLKDGYPDDLYDNTITGKKITKSGTNQEILEQEEGREFLLQKVRFVPIDDKGNEFSGTEWSVLKNARGLKIKIEYIIKRVYGEQKERIDKKASSATVNFINLDIINQ